MTHSFGEGYSTRSDEEGFGGVYGGNDPVENPGTEKIHPSHPGTCTPPCDLGRALISR